MEFQKTFYASDSGNERERSVRTFVPLFVPLSEPVRPKSRHSHDIGLDMTRRSARARACYESVSQTRSRPERAKRLTESRRARLEREHLSRDIAHQCARMRSCVRQHHRHRQAGFHQYSTAMAWERRKTPIAAAVSETIASLCPGFEKARVSSSSFPHIHKPSS
jgi:hypothetical protein